MKKTNLEITTYIGCKVLCKYCPQGKLIKAYKSNKKLMTFDDFKKILENVDSKKTRLIFAGFSEIFLNKYAVDMLIYAYKKGFETDVYTTTVGLTKNKIMKLAKENVKLRFVAFHVFDSKVNPINDSFYKKADLFKNNITVKAVKLIKVTDVFSRAGTLFKVNKSKEKIFCLRNFVYQNVVLPNGDLVLCCHDYLLRHKLGNLFLQHYSGKDIAKKREEILNLMQDKNSEIACRYCDNGKNIKYKKQQTFDLNRNLFKVEK